MHQTLLAPAAWLYGRMAQRRFEKNVSYRSRLPVICVGNFTAGGTGKTPLTQSIASLIAANGERPVVLSRGYGGAMRGPVFVDGQLHRAAEVGDEPLLLSRTVPVVISRDRRAGVQLIEAGSGEAGGADAVIMDDGLQNAALKKDLVIALVDGARGIGNGAVIPAGPLRAPMEFQFGLADAIVVNGRSAIEGRETAVLDELRRRFPGPVLEARVAPAGDVDWLGERPILAYSGIGNPARFFTTLSGLGANVVETRTFGDHHQFKEREASDLIAAAEALGAQLVTTEKDWVRLSREGGALEALQQASRPLPIRLTFEEQDSARLASLVDAAVKTGGYRRGVPQP
ncbi:MAG: tetraacyldisaccharide 4'-kinase [Hyphomicrobiaceae bacterium]|nr:tetraacyldisaccharide 4'-kinase [Hyphomicrobiaceae bacterium]